MNATSWAAEFALRDDIIYLNHAAVAPWPIRASRAAQNFAEENATSGALNYPRWNSVEKQLKQRFATLINAPSADDIALLKNTSEALSVVAWGIDWRDGDNVVTSNQEFPSNRIVWESLAALGVTVRAVDLHSADTPEAALLQAVDGRTRVLAISSVQYSTGLRMDLPRLGNACRKRAVLFCVDAIQSLGALRFDVQEIQADFVAADGHKWLLGPEGVAVFYCRAELRESLQLRQFGWHMIEEVGDYTRTDWTPAHSARRFECGSINMLGIHTMEAGLSLLQDVGMEAVEQQVLNNSAWLLEQLGALPDYALITDPTPDRYAGIVTFRHRRADAKILHQHLQDHGIFCAPRGGGIRFSPHFYTRREHLQRAVDICRRFS